MIVNVSAAYLTMEIFGFNISSAYINPGAIMARSGLFEGWRLLGVLSLLLVLMALGILAWDGGEDGVRLVIRPNRCCAACGEPSPIAREIRAHDRPRARAVNSSAAST